MFQSIRARKVPSADSWVRFHIGKTTRLGAQSIPVSPYGKSIALSSALVNSVHRPVSLYESIQIRSNYKNLKLRRQVYIRDD